MNFVKKNLKWIITIIGVIIVTTGISVYATGQYLASQVDYNKNGQAKVSDALDDLYSKSNTTINNLNSQISSLETQLANTTNAGASGNITTTDTTTTHTITLGFRPTKIFFKIPTASNGMGYLLMYEPSSNTNIFAVGYNPDSFNSDNNSTTTYWNNGLAITVNLTNTGFTYKCDMDAVCGRTYWYAIK